MNVIREALSREIRFLRPGVVALGSVLVGIFTGSLVYHFTRGTP